MTLICGPNKIFLKKKNNKARDENELYVARWCVMRVHTKKTWFSIVEMFFFFLVKQ